jgi:hypothetical protein
VKIVLSALYFGLFVNVLVLGKPKERKRKVKQMEPNYHNWGFLVGLGGLVLKQS